MCRECSRSWECSGEVPIVLRATVGQRERCPQGALMTFCVLCYGHSSSTLTAFTHLKNVVSPTGC